MEKEKIVYMPIKALVPYAKNPRNNENAVKYVAESISQFGFKNPVIIDKDNIIICGHTRVKAAEKLGIEVVPVIKADDLTDEQIKAFRLADNKTAEVAEWDMDLLAEELEGITDINMADFAFDIESDTAAVEPEETYEDDFDEEPPEEPKAKPGEIYQLGRHRLMCGDSTKKEDIEKLMNGEKATLVFTDPPYGMKKEKDGVANDNLNYDDLLEFNKKWIPQSFDALKENGSWYCWGIDEPLMDIYSGILRPMKKRNEITFRNLITWKKENDNPTMIFNGACASGNRSFYTNEKCLFVMKGVQGFNNNSDNYYMGYEPIRSYLEGEAKKVGLNNKKLKEITGVGMYAHWFTTSQYTLIPEEHYKKLQDYYKDYGAFKKDYGAFKKDYGAIKKEHDKIKEEYYSSRAYFNGDASQCIDVWVHDTTSQKERELTGNHATPKPLELCARGIKASSRKGDIVLDMFGGSGSTLIACEQLERTCYAMELEPKYVDTIINRYEKITGDKAVLITEDKGKDAAGE